MLSVMTIAQNVSRYMYIGESGEVKVSSRAPQWVHEFIRYGVGAMFVLGDQWRLRMVYEVLNELEDGREPAEAVRRVARRLGEPTDAPAQWLASHPDRYAYVDEARAFWGVRESIIDEIRYGMRVEVDECMQRLMRWLERDSDD